VDYPGIHEDYLKFAGIFFIVLEKLSCSVLLTALNLTLVDAGSLPRKLLSFKLFLGRIGLLQKPPPQFGQTFSRILSTQFLQKVHS